MARLGQSVSAIVGLIAFVATYAMTFEALTFWQALGASVLAQVIAFLFTWALEERL